MRPSFARIAVTVVIATAVTTVTSLGWAGSVSPQHAPIITLIGASDVHCGDFTEADASNTAKERDDIHKVAIQHAKNLAFGSKLALRLLFDAHRQHEAWLFTVGDNAAVTGRDTRASRDARGRAHKDGITEFACTDQWHYLTPEDGLPAERRIWWNAPFPEAPDRQVMEITLPTIGNHERDATWNAQGYFEAFGAQIDWLKHDEPRGPAKPSAVYETELGPRAYYAKLIGRHWLFLSLDSTLGTTLRWPEKGIAATENSGPVAAVSPSPDPQTPCKGEIDRRASAPAELEICGLKMMDVVKRAHGSLEPNHDEAGQAPWVARQVAWAREHNRCVIAVWHHPTRTGDNSTQYDQGAMADIWSEIYGTAGLVVTGHAHWFEQERLAGKDLSKRATHGLLELNLAAAGGVPSKPHGMTTEMPATEAFGSVKERNGVPIRSNKEIIGVLQLTLTDSSRPQAKWTFWGQETSEIEKGWDRAEAKRIEHGTFQCPPFP